MKINKPFEQIKVIFSDEELAEKLVSKKTVVDLVKKKVRDIVIEDDVVKCKYQVDSKYSYNLHFVRNEDNTVEFNARISGFYWLLVVGLLFGYKLDLGWIGFLLGPVLLLVVSFAFKYFVVQGMANRIYERWDDLV